MTKKELVLQMKILNLPILGTEFLYNSLGSLLSNYVTGQIWLNYDYAPFLPPLSFENPHTILLHTIEIVQIAKLVQI